MDDIVKPMDTNQEQANNDGQPYSQGQRKIIQPINPEEPPSNIDQNPPVSETGLNAAPAGSQNSLTNDVYPQSPVASSPSDENSKPDQDWKPNTTLASRVPALRNYGLALTIGSLLFMYINRSIWKFSGHTGARALGIVIYTVLGLILIAGLVCLLSKSKDFVLLCLNAVTGFSVLVGLLSMLSLNIVTAVLALVIIASIINIKEYVKRAA